MQSLPLNAKIRMTQNRIKAWYDHWDGNVYCSFSGGKDSTVLVDIITKMGYTDIPLVFIDTGLEYPEIRDFVKGYGDRVVWLKPEKNFKQVINEYGYPFISKEVSGSISEAWKYVMKNTTKSEIPRIEQIKKRVINGEVDLYDLPLRICQLMGTIDNYGERYLYLDKKEKSTYNKEKYAFLLDADFKTSNQCCNVMKKNTVKKYHKQTGRFPVTAQMASESLLRRNAWIKNGCNAFEAKNPISNPMSFWTEQDVLKYIKKNNIPIASVYGDIVYDEPEQLDGQINFADFYSDVNIPLKTTKLKRTGCMFCGYGMHLFKKDEKNTFEIMRETHPKQYDYIMRPKEEGGLDYKNVIDWLNKNGNLNIRY